MPFQAGGKRTASIICRTPCKLISIHADAFQEMIEDCLVDFPDDPDDPLSSASINTATRRSLSLAAADSVSLGRQVSARQASLQETIQALEAKKHRKSQMIVYRLWSLLKSSFAKSMMSRSDLSSSSYAPGSGGLSAQLAGRAVAARSTIKAWCDLVNMVVPAVVTIPLPEQLTEMQVFSHAFPHLFAAL